MARSQLFGLVFVSLVMCALSCQWLSGQDVVGDNLQQRYGLSMEQCCELCNSISNCLAASYWDGICFPKASRATTPKGGVTALIKAGPGPNPPPPGPNGTRYCLSAGDLNFEHGNINYANGGWEMRGDARVSSKTAFNLLGGSVEWYMDVSGVADGINTNLYTVSPKRYNCGGGCYCDIQAGNYESCMELDFTENNGKCAMATTIHTWPNNNGGCDRGGCQSVSHLSSQNVHFLATIAENGAITVFVNGAPNNHYGPGVSQDSLNAIVNTMRTDGAVIESSQWYGWVPAGGQCPGGGSGGLGNSFVKVTNVRVMGSVVRGPTPTRC